MGYTREQIYEAMRNADKAGRADDVRALAGELQRMEAPAQGKDKRPTSHVQGFIEGITPYAANAVRFFERTNPVIAAGRAVAGMGASLADPAVAAQQQASQRSRYQGSGLGQFAGAMVGSAPTFALPGGIVAQGAAAGAMGTEHPNNMRELAVNTGLGAATAGVIGAAGRHVVAPVARAARNAARPAADSARAVAQRLGVRSTPATVGGALSQIAQTAIGATPGGFGPVARGAEREVGDLANVAREVAGRMGPVGTPESAGRAVARGARAYSRATSARGGAMYRQRDALMGGENAPVLLGNAARTIQEFQQQFPNTPVLATIMEHPTVRRIAEALPDGAAPEVTVSEATDALSHVRAAVRNSEKSNTITGAVKARIGQFERAIEGDVMRAAQASDAIAGRSGPASAQGMQTAADAYWSQRSRTLQGPLKKAMAAYRSPEVNSPQAAYRQMVTDMQREGGNITSLRRAWGALPRGARRTFAATHMDQMGRAKPGVQDAAGEEWSFNTFLTNYDKTAPEARAMIFGDAANQVDDIARYATALRRTDRLRNFSNTARTYIAGAYLTTLGSQIWQGDVGGTAGTVAALPAAALGGRAFMASPAGRAWMRNALRAMTRAGTPGAERALGRLTAQLPVIAQSNPALRSEATALFNAINDNTASVGVRAAAGDRPEDQNK